MDSNNEQLVVQSEQEKEKDGEVTIDLGRILRALLHYIWIIIVATVLGAMIMLGYTKFFITAMYTSTATIYVSNSNTTTITESDSNVAEVVSAVIKSRDTINMAIEDSELDYTYSQIYSALTVTVGEAGILTFSVELSDPYDAYEVATAIIEALDKRAQTTEGGENVFKQSLYYSVITNPIVPSSKSSPNTTQNVIIGALAGFVLSCAVIAVLEIVNNKIYNSEYLITTYNLPVLTEIPDFSDKRNSKKGYYSKYGGYGYGYGGNSGKS